MRSYCLQRQPQDGARRHLVGETHEPAMPLRPRQRDIGMPDQGLRIAACFRVDGKAGAS
ncbi:MAG: hypothetical protein R3D03_05765 [Geminicoccaceae bacterium]